MSFDTNDRRELVDGNNPVYSPTGHLIYARVGSLWAVRFDIAQLDTIGEPVPVLQGVWVGEIFAPQFTVSNNGSLIDVSGTAAAAADRSLVWVDRQGREEPKSAEPHAYNYPRMSPDGTRVALEIVDQEQDIWIWDLAGETLTRLTRDPASDYYPVWTPDAQRVLFGSNRETPPQVFAKAADGTGNVERLTDHSDGVGPLAISADGQHLVMQARNSSVADLVRMALEGDRAVEGLLKSGAVERSAALSPNGRWLAYQSDESEQFEIYVRPFPDVEAGKRPVSRAGGTKPAWSRDGLELFYLDLAPNLVAVPVGGEGAAFTHGDPEVLFPVLGYVTTQSGAYDVSPNGERFLLIKQGTADEISASPDIILIQNWHQGLLERVPIP